MVDSEPNVSEKLTFSQLPELYGHSRKVYALAFNKDGSYLASGCVDKSIRVWSIEKEKDYIVELRGHSDAIHSVTWDPTNTNRLASTGADKTIRLWDVKAGRVSHSISTQSEALNIVYSHDGKYIAVSNLDCISLIDSRKNRVVRRVVNPYEVNEIQFSKTGFLFAAAGHPSGYGTFEVMRIDAESKGNPNLENVHKVIAHAGSCFSLDFDPSGRKLALGGVDSLVSTWDLDELYCEKTFVVTSSAVRTVRYNYDGSCLAIGTEENNLTVVDPNSGETAFIVQTQTVPQYFSWHPTKNLLAYVGDKPSSERNEKRDGVIKLLEVKKQEHAP